MADIDDKDKSLEDEIESVAPKAAHRKQIIGTGEATRTYVQRPLSFFGKLQFFEVLGKAIEQAMTGDEALSLNNLFAGPSMTRAQDGSITVTDVEDADTFVRAIAKIAVYAPDMLADLYCIFLDVPVGERPFAKGIMVLSEEEGGLSDEDGIAILETFFDQNGQAMRDFFVDRLMPLLGRARGRFDVGQEASSKPSRSTRRSTQSRSKTS